MPLAEVKDELIDLFLSL